MRKLVKMVEKEEEAHEGQEGAAGEKRCDVRKERVSGLSNLSDDLLHFRFPFSLPCRLSVVRAHFINFSFTVLIANLCGAFEH